MFILVLTQVSSCMQCGEGFSFFSKKKSCYACGKVDAQSLSSLIIIITHHHHHHHHFYHSSPPPPALSLQVICTECSRNKECLRYMGQEMKRVCDACYDIIQHGRGMLPKIFNELLDGVG